MDAPLPKPPTDDAKPPAPPKEDRPIGPWGGEPMPADPDKDEDWPAPGPEIPAPYQDQRPDPEVFGGPDPGAPPPNPNPQTFEKPRFMCNALDDAEAEMRKLWAWRERRKRGLIWELRRVATTSEVLLRRSPYWVDRGHASQNQSDARCTSLLYYCTCTVEAR